MEYLDVLVLCSDPVNLHRTLNLAQELVHFEDLIRRSELPIRLRRVFPPTLEQLQREFAQAAERGRQPNVFHFLGHGDDDGLYFENEHGEAHLVKGHELKAALEQSPVKLVLLNACWSATRRGVSLCDFLTREKVADAAIGHETPVADESAIEFARQFYALIIQGKSIRDACRRARNSLAEQGKRGAADVELVGDGDLVLTAGLAGSERPCVIESGFPKFGSVPEPPVFYGRGEELVQLSRSLADARLTGFGLWGIGGIGKTALAKVTARRNAWRYQGVVWVDIRDATQKTTAELLRLALCRLHPGAPDADPMFELVRRLQETPSLIVLDNLEDLPASEHASLARFLQSVPRNGSRVLLTARVPLPEIERLSDLQSRRMTEGLDTWNGAHYVQHVARQKQCLALQDELRSADSRLEGLCVLVTQRLHGHPKMLELAVGVALQGRQTLEQALVALPEEIEQQLTALLATSLHYLSDDGHRVLPLLALFPTGNLTPEALEVVGRSLSLDVENPVEETVDSESQAQEAEDDEEEPDPRWLSQGREQLVAAGLLEYHQPHDVYTFHQSILDEAQRRQPGEEIRAAAVIGLLMHYAEYVRTYSADNERIDRCFENAVMLMESLWSGREGESPLDALLAEMAERLGSYFEQRGLWRLGGTWHERAIELHRSSSHAQNAASLAHELYQQGKLLASQGDPVAARDALNESLRLNELAGNQRGVGAGLHELAILESAQGNPSEARRLLQRSLAIFESLGDQRGLSASLHVLAILESDQGNPSEARRLLQRSLAIKESLGDQRGLSASLHQLAIVESAQGNPSEARRLLQRSLAIDESLDHQRGLSASLHELARIESAQGNPSEARRLLQRSLAIKESLGDQRGLSASLHQLARIESAQGNPSEARRLWERSIQIDQTTGDVAGGAATKIMLAQLEAMESRFDRAIELASQAVQVFEQLGYAQAEQARGILEDIQQFAAQATSGERSSEPRSDESGNSLVAPELSAAMKLLEQEEFVSAVPLLEQALAKARTAEDRPSGAICQFYLGQVALMQDRSADAVTALREALELATQADNADLIRAVQQVLTVATRAAAQHP